MAHPWTSENGSRFPAARGVVAVPWLRTDCTPSSPSSPRRRRRLFAPCRPCHRRGAGSGSCAPSPGARRASARSARASGSFAAARAACPRSSHSARWFATASSISLSTCFGSLIEPDASSRRWRSARATSSLSNSSSYFASSGNSLPAVCSSSASSSVSVYARSARIRFLILSRRSPAARPAPARLARAARTPGARRAASNEHEQTTASRLLPLQPLLDAIADRVSSSSSIQPQVRRPAGCRR